MFFSENMLQIITYKSSAIVRPLESIICKIKPGPFTHKHPHCWTSHWLPSARSCQVSTSTCWISISENIFVFIIGKPKELIQENTIEIISLKLCRRKLSWVPIKKKIYLESIAESQNSLYENRTNKMPCGSM